MTPQKARRPRQRQHHSGPSQLQQVQASDYESEPPPPDIRPPIRTNTELNLSVLTRYNPAIQHISSMAAACHVYHSDLETKQWKRAEIEGTFFICKLFSPPITSDEQFGIVVLNRKSPENLIFDMKDVVGMQVSETFIELEISVKGETGERQIRPFGLYLPDPSNRQENHDCIQACWEKTRDGKNEMHAMEEKMDGYGAFEAPPPETQQNNSGGGRRLSISDLFGQR